MSDNTKIVSFDSDDAHKKIKTLHKLTDKRDTLTVKIAAIRKEMKLPQESPPLSEYLVRTTIKFSTAAINTRYQEIKLKSVHKKIEEILFERIQKMQLIRHEQRILSSTIRETCYEIFASIYIHKNDKKS